MGMVSEKFRSINWDKQQDDFLAANYGNADDHMIAKCLGRKVEQIHHRANILGLKKWGQ
jgi:hypothetical protein